MDTSVLLILNKSGYKENGSISDNIIDILMQSSETRTLVNELKRHEAANEIDWDDEKIIKQLQYQFRYAVAVALIKLKSMGYVDVKCVNKKKIYKITESGMSFLKVLNSY